MEVGNSKDGIVVFRMFVNHANDAKVTSANGLLSDLPETCATNLKLLPMADDSLSTGQSSCGPCLHLCRVFGIVLDAGGGSTRNDGVQTWV